MNEWLWSYTDPLLDYLQPGVPAQMQFNDTESVAPSGLCFN